MLQSNKLHDLRIIYILLFFNITSLLYISDVSQWVLHISLYTTSLLLGNLTIVFLFLEYKTKNLGSPTAITAGLFLPHFVIPGVMLSAGSLFFVNNENFMFATEAQLLVIASLISFKVGSFLAATKVSPQRRKILPYQWKPHNILPIILTLLLTGWLIRLIFIAKGMYFQETRTNDGGLGGIYSSMRQAERFPMLALYITSIFHYSRYRITKHHQQSLSNFWHHTMLSIIGLELIYWLPSGRKTDLLFVILIPFIIKYIYTKKLPSKKTIIILTMLVLVYFPASYMYRISMSMGGHANMSVTDGFIATINDIKTGRNNRILEHRNKNYTIARLNLLEPISATIRLVESGLWPVSYGGDYIGLFINLIPRVLWEDKPSFHYGTEFGYKAGYLSHLRSETSISVTFIGEAYFNFRWLAPLVMFCFGYFFSYIYYKSTTTKSLNWTLLYILTFSILLYPGGTFVLYFGGLIKSWLVAGILIKLMTPLSPIYPVSQTMQSFHSKNATGKI